MLYVQRFKSGVAKISPTKPKNDDPYLMIESLPPIDGHYELTEDMELVPVGNLKVESHVSLESQIQALSTYQDFLEECIIEMAQVIYE